eukprot:TRINITY_DN10898_c0_g1_i1.p1 TRINITY_DN10898_c0_g1~~TRINITY_DN10898_c0_g1_i1.p1  ORF type:complete len:280 (-),score=49.96 TRINITY_DN10898_c0_g1_i1:17-832(-)
MALQLLELPDEILGAIFEFLPDKEIGAIGRICRRTRELGNDDELWKRIVARAYGAVNDSDIIAARVPEKYKHFCHFKQVYVSGICRFDPTRAAVGVEIAQDLVRATKVVQNEWRWATATYPIADRDCYFEVTIEALPSAPDIFFGVTSIPTLNKQAHSYNEAGVYMYHRNQNCMYVPHTNEALSAAPAPGKAGDVIGFYIQRKDAKSTMWIWVNQYFIGSYGELPGRSIVLYPHVEMFAVGDCVSIRIKETPAYVLTKIDERSNELDLLHA